MPWDIAGHSATTAVLRSALESGQVGHAYMLAGPQGIGKARLAFLFAQGLLCSDPTDRPCGKCLSCRKVRSGNHPDYHWVSPAGNSFRIDQVRALQAEMALRPYEGRYKVCVLDNADLLTEQAQNSMLKFLEEPTGNSVILLVVHNPSALLPTIHSRCQVLRMRPLAEADIAQLLMQNRGLGAAEAALLAALSDGRPGLALSLDLEATLEQRNKVAAWCRALERDGLKGMLQVAQEMEQEEDIGAALAAMSVWLRDVWHASLGAGLPIANRDRAEELQQAALCWGQAAADAIAAVSETRRLLARNANKRLALDCMLMRMQRGIPS